MCLYSKSMIHKFYETLQSFLVPMYWEKDLLIDFITGLPVFTNWKDETYNSILVIVNQFIKIVNYKPVKVIINVPGLVKVIIQANVLYYDLLDAIISDYDSVFTLKFLFL